MIAGRLGQGYNPFPSVVGSRKWGFQGSSKERLLVVNIIDGILIYIYYPAQQFRLSFRLNIDAASFSHFTAILARTISRLSFLTLAFFLSAWPNLVR